MLLFTRSFAGPAVAGLLALLIGCGRSAPPAVDTATPPWPAAVNAAAATISADYLRDVVAEIADDRYEGRQPGSRGDTLTRAWLAAELERRGFAPGGPDGSWEQPFELVGLQATMPGTWTFTAGEHSLALAWRDQFMAGSGRQEQQTAVNGAELVFVGYGIQAPQYGWDDFKGRDLHGKLLLVLNNDPDWDPALFAGTTRLYFGRWTYKYESAARQGAAGAIIIHTTPSAGYPWQVVQTSWQGEQFELPAEGEPRIGIKAWVTEDAARQLVALGGRSLDELVAAARRPDFEPVALGARSSIEFRTTLTRTRTANVLGLLRGADPVLRKEVVIFTAHHDHLGVGEPDATGDRIYNGALDNGAGVAQVLSIGRAFAALPEPPRRSVLLNFVGAEEANLLGSLYYAQHPTFAPGRIAADVNFDGGNIYGRARDLVLIGRGKSSLDGVAETVAARQGRVVAGDPFPDRGYFYRSDQFSFARIGVPGLYIYKSVDIIGREPGWGAARIEAYEAQDYHQPSDELSEDWNFDGMVENAQAGFLAGYIVANADAMPAWVPGDEFEAARRAALAALAP